MLLKRIFKVVILLLVGCNDSKKQDIQIPEDIRQLENLTVYNPTSQQVDTVKLKKETVFESDEETFIPGYINQLEVDDLNRVYIGASGSGEIGVYVFTADGKYITTIGKQGKGPGEYESIGSISIADDRVYLFDSRLQKFGIYSLPDLLHIEDRLIRKDESEIGNMTANLRGNQLIVTENGDHIVRLQSLAFDRESDVSTVVYNKLSQNGRLLPEFLLNVERFPFYYPGDSGPELPFTMPFTRSSLVAFTESGELLTVWTEDFLIKKYDREGNYIRAYYYPVEKSTLQLEDMEIDRERKRILDKYEMPETWPAIHTMEVDNEERLWIATITGDKKSFRWWVLNSNGELVARFSLPGNRTSRNVMSEPLVKIKNGYFYKHLFDFHNQIDQIVKYKINFK